MCSARWSNGAVATGIARRAVTAQFRGDVVAVYDSLKAQSCPAVEPGAAEGHEGPVRRRRDRPLLSCRAALANPALGQS